MFVRSVKTKLLVLLVINAVLITIGLHYYSTKNNKSLVRLKLDEVKSPSTHLAASNKIRPEPLQQAIHTSNKMTPLSKPQEKLTMLVMTGGKRIDQLPDKCGNCELSSDKSKINNPNTKALIFRFNDPIYQIAPKKRRLDQYYIWKTIEGPIALYVFRRMTLKEYDGFFNLTMTYRTDSDIWGGYGTNYSLIDKFPNLPFNDSTIDAIVKKKDKVALWAVSNCATLKGAQDRMKYAKDLVASGLNVDLVGGCFNRRGKFEYSEYKFYLAFENQWNCKEYITEKYWDNALREGTVPVVLGAPKKDYIRVSPSPHSFIYALDYNSPKELADYLNYLDKNDTAYKEYLGWMKTIPHYEEKMKKVGWCELCSFLHENNHKNAKPRVVPSLFDYFYGQDYHKCLGIPNVGLEI